MEKYTIPEAVRILNVKYAIEQIIYIILRERNVIDQDNRPIQEYVDDGYLDFNVPRYEVWYGEIQFPTTLVVGERGLNFLKQIIEDYLKAHPPHTFPRRKDYLTGTDI